MIVPTHDRSALLALALHSALWQRDVGFELIVVDDGSSDSTSRLVRGLGDPRVRLLRHATARGVSVARNHGIEEARGEWVAFLDDDDLWAPDKLVSQLEVVRAAGRRWVYTGAVNVTVDLTVLGGAPPALPEVVAAALPRANLVPGGCSAAMAHRNSLHRLGAFDPAYRHLADWDLWIRLAGDGPPASVPRPLVGYRIHSANASLDTAGMVAELDVIESRYGGPVDRQRFHRHVARISMRASRHGDALRHYVRAALMGGRDYRPGQIVADVREVAEATFARARRRLGVTGAVPPAPPARASDPHAGWRAETDRWLGDLRRLLVPSGSSAGTTRDAIG